MSKNLTPRYVTISVRLVTEGYDTFEGSIDLSLHGTPKESHEAAQALIPILFAESQKKFADAYKAEQLEKGPAPEMAVAAAAPPKEEVPF